MSNLKKTIQNNSLFIPNQDIWISDADLKGRNIFVGIGLCTFRNISTGVPFDILQFILLWWFGESLTDIGKYIADARDQNLPLLGNGQHDWAYLLGKWQLLLQDKTIGSTVWGIGMFIMGAAIIWAIFSIHEKQKN